MQYRGDISMTGGSKPSRRPSQTCLGIGRKLKVAFDWLCCEIRSFRLASFKPTVLWMLRLQVCTTVSRQKSQEFKRKKICRVYHLYSCSHRNRVSHAEYDIISDFSISKWKTFILSQEQIHAFYVCAWGRAHMPWCKSEDTCRGLSFPLTKRHAGTQPGASGVVASTSTC